MDEQDDAFNPHDPNSRADVLVWPIFMWMCAFNQLSSTARISVVVVRRFRFSSRPINCDSSTQSGRHITCTLISFPSQLNFHRASSTNCKCNAMCDMAKCKLETEPNYIDRYWLYYGSKASSNTIGSFRRNTKQCDFELSRRGKLLTLKARHLHPEIAFPIRPKTHHQNSECAKVSPNYIRHVNL